MPQAVLGSWTRAQVFQISITKPWYFCNFLVSQEPHHSPTRVKQPTKTARSAVPTHCVQKLHPSEEPLVANSDETFKAFGDALSSHVPTQILVPKGGPYPSEDTLSILLVPDQHTSQPKK